MDIGGKLLLGLKKIVISVTSNILPPMSVKARTPDFNF